MNKEESIVIIKELLETCTKMEEIYLCMVPPTGFTPIISHGYQVHIRTTHPFDEETANCIQEVTKKHKLSAQEIKEEEKMVIYKKH